MEYLMKAQIVKPVGYETVPPAEVVADQKHRSACGIDAAVKLNIMELTFQAVLRIEAEEANKEGYMSCLDHFEVVTEISDLSGLR